MEPDEAIDSLLESCVLVRGQGEDELTVSAEFRSAVAKRTQRITTGSAQLPPEGLSAWSTTWEFDEGVGQERLVGMLWCLQEWMDDLKDEQATRLVFVLDWIEHPPDATAGTPTGFLPVRGERLPALFPLLRRSIVYFWREDCGQCDEMRGKLAYLPAGVREKFVLLSVYGPSSPRLIRETFDVAVAPTTLFVRDGAVDARLVGAVEPSVIESEMAASFGIDDTPA